MNKPIFLTSIILLTTACNGVKSPSDDFYTIDVRGNFPKKELLVQDIMDVEYIMLETSDEFLCSGIVKDIGKDHILVMGGLVRGDILVFDRSGKGLRRINHNGRGSQEYASLSPTVFLDEENNEMYVSDNTTNKIIVYDLFGVYLRSFPFPKGLRSIDVSNFDKERLICTDTTESDDVHRPQFFFLSKQDGSIIHQILIPIKERISGILRAQQGDVIVNSYLRINPVIPLRNATILSLFSSDTLYNFTSHNSLTPFMVRTPPVHSMTPQVLLVPGICTEHYIFLETIKLAPEVHGTTPYDMEMYIPRTDLVYDTMLKCVYQVDVFNDDFIGKKSIDLMQKTMNKDIAFTQTLGADLLTDLFQKGELKGKLKEAAAGLSEDSNPVIMLVKYKR